jgi:pimeloyl-ACP methyl ester carboxylesterase
LAVIPAAPAEQTRALYPESEGYVEREGVRTFWEVYGHGSPSVFFVPPWAIVHSRCWKLQLPYFGRHYRALTFDPRGNGKSDRPQDAEAYSDAEYAADALAVMDATGTDRAVLVTLSAGARRCLLMAAEHPERVAGVVFIAPAVPLALNVPGREEWSFEDPLDTDEGWAKFNVHYWRREYRSFIEFFMSMMFTEPHSTKQFEDAVGWGLETDPETLIATRRGPALTKEETLDLAARMRCPVMVIHGTDDHIRPHASGAALAEATGGTFVTMEGSGHAPQARDPVKINLLIREFVEGLR